MIFCEAVSNPLLETAKLRELSKLAKKHNLQLVVDYTFSPLCITPQKLGPDIMIHPLIKFINGSSDTVGGVICGPSEFINQLKNVNEGACMLLGAMMDSFRSASILKNLRTFHIRMHKHSENAMHLAEKFQELGFKTFYPGLENRHGHKTLEPEFDINIILRFWFLDN